MQTNFTDSSGVCQHTLLCVQKEALFFVLSDWFVPSSNTKPLFYSQKKPNHPVFLLVITIWLWWETFIWNPVLRKRWRRAFSANSFRKASWFSSGKSLQSFPLSVCDYLWSYFYTTSSVVWSQYCICRSKISVCTYLKSHIWYSDAKESTVSMS